MNPTEKRIKNLRMDSYTDAISDLNRFTLTFHKDYIESKFSESTLQFNARTFRVICMIAIVVHGFYAIKDSIGETLVTAPLRAFGLIPFILGCYLLTRSRWIRNKPDNFYWLAGILVLCVVGFQLSFTWMAPSVFTQITHTIPAIIYGGFLFTGLKFRHIIYYVGPLVIVAPIVFVWTQMNYGFAQSVDATIILTINFIIAVFGKYNLELFHRRSFITQEIQEIQQDLIVTYTNQVDEQKEELKKSKEHLEKINNQKNKFFSIISHDLKGPFNTVTNLADLLQRSDHLTDEEMDQLVGHLATSSKNAQELLINLLTWSKTQLDGVTVNKSALSIYEIVEEVKEVLESNLIEKGISVSNEISRGLIVSVDMEMMKVVVRNLLSNAIKYSNSNTVITCMIDEESKHSATVSFLDQGVGIPAIKLDKLFRLDLMESTRGTRQEPGTGLGLIICKEFAELNGGGLAVNSQEGIGTTVRLTMPKPEGVGKPDLSLELSR